MFFIFVHNRSFLDILPNFNRLRTLELVYLDLYSWMSFSQKYHRVEIIITITQILTHILEKMTSFSPVLNQDWEQGKLTIKEQGWLRMEKINKDFK